MEVLHAAEFETPVGRMRAVSSSRGLVYVELPNASGRGLGGWLSRHAPGAKVLDGYSPNRAAISQVQDYLEGKRDHFDLSVDMRGTSFQVAVFQEVEKIPYGETVTYSDIASRMQRPKAVRAVGAANGANPLPLVIPCHRVVGASGRLQGYAGGLDLKARLLALESGRPRDGWLL